MDDTAPTVDLRSDTVTRPDDRMRDAARDAAVGDDVYHDDPTVNELQQRAAEVVGTEAALYMPSGTMCNQVACRVHTERGQEALLDVQSHIYKWELGGLAQHSQVQARTFDAGSRAVPTPEQVRAGYVEADAHRPGTGLLAVENTHNSRGGVSVAPERVDEAARAAHDLDVPVHLDGARLFNAAVAEGVPASRICREVDTVTFCLSKGLGAPVGSILAGPEAFVSEARRVRKLMGGGMRQAGMIAAPGLVALENRDRLQADHDNAARLAAALDGVGGLRVPEPDTNIVLLNTEGTGLSAAEFVERCEQRGVRSNVFDTDLVRFCTHLDVDEAAVETAIDRVSAVVEAA
jgi:threonine aldolase